MRRKMANAQQLARKFLKAEILFTRYCNISCKYCGMKRKNVAEISMELWRKGLENIKALGCDFCAIYGAEPLTRFERLKQFLKECTEIGIKNSVITNGIGLTRDKFAELYQSGLRSITLSCDAWVPCDLHCPDEETTEKSRQAIRIISLLKTLEDEFPMRDIEVIATLTKKNLRQFPDMLRFFSSQGVWTSFDFIHSNRQMRGSKCPPISVIGDLLFSPADDPEVLAIFDEVRKLRQEGCLLHQTEGTLDFLMRDANYRRQTWHCSYPGWISVDADGSLLGCDDFPDKVLGTFKIWELEKNWETFRGVWRERVKHCQGCAWTTHWMSEKMVLEPDAAQYFAHELG